MKCPYCSTKLAFYDEVIFEVDEQANEVTGEKYYWCENCNIDFETHIKVPIHWDKAKEIIYKEKRGG